MISIHPSSIRNAGRGVYNNSGKIIPVGTMFGPYRGSLISVDEYNKKSESGYAWELMDKEKKRVLGYVDPGLDVDPQTDWLAMVNSANYQCELTSFTKK